MIQGHTWKPTISFKEEIAPAGTRQSAPSSLLRAEPPAKAFQLSTRLAQPVRQRELKDPLKRQVRQPTWLPPKHCRHERKQASYDGEGSS